MSEKDKWILDQAVQKKSIVLNGQNEEIHLFTNGDNTKHYICVELFTQYEIAEYFFFKTRRRLKEDIKQLELDCVQREKPGSTQYMLVSEEDFYFYLLRCLKQFFHFLIFDFFIQFLFFYFLENMQF